MKSVVGIKKPQRILRDRKQSKGTAQQKCVRIIMATLKHPKPASSVRRTERGFAVTNRWRNHCQLHSPYFDLEECVDIY
jgi:hypothetical protein